MSTPTDYLNHGAHDMATYTVTFRTLSGDLTGIVLNVLKDGALVTRTNIAAVQASAIMRTLNEIRHLMAAKGISEAR